MVLSAVLEGRFQEFPMPATEGQVSRIEVSTSLIVQWISNNSHTIIAQRYAFMCSSCMQRDPTLVPGDGDEGGPPNPHALG